MSNTNIFRFHLGTAALGAMLLTIIQGIKALIDVTKRIFEGEGYYSANFGIECCQDIFHVLVFVLQYANNYAYIICSVHGTDFFRSARHVYNLIMKNVILTLASAMVKKKKNFILFYRILSKIFFFFL